MDLPQCPVVQDVPDDFRLVEDVRAGVGLECAVRLGGHFGAQIAQVDTQRAPSLTAAPTNMRRIPVTAHRPPAANACAQVRPTLLLARQRGRKCPGAARGAKFRSPVRRPVPDPRGRPYAATERPQSE